MDQLICASLSQTHYWYEVDMLKVPANIGYKDRHSSWNLIGFPNGTDCSRIGSRGIISDETLYSYINMEIFIDLNRGKSK